MDLWVASLFPGDVLDLSFDIVTCADGGADPRTASLDALHFARGFIVPATRELWWDDPADRVLHGRRAQSIAVRRTAEPTPDVRPAPDPAQSSSGSGTSAVARIHQLLPHTARYPRVEWRFSA